MPNQSIEVKKQYIRQLEAIIKDYDHPSSWYDDILDIWRLIAKYECIEYLRYLADERDFNIEKIGDKTHSIFENLLEDYSIGQIFNITWQAVRDTTDYIVKERISRSHGKNMFIGRIQQKADKARAEGWEIRNSRRDFNCPQTVLSLVFFNTFMGLGDKCLERVIPA